MPEYKIYGQRTVKIEAIVVAADAADAEELVFTAWSGKSRPGGVLSFQEYDEPWLFDTYER